MTKNQQLTFWLLVIASIIIRIILIPCNMMDMGDSATRVWNALWWAQNPFFVLPESGHPFWFYFMGLILMVTREIFYTPIIVMILLMTIAGIYLFKTAFLLADFRTAILTFCIFMLNPVIFRLNFEPYAQQTYLAAACVMIYYLIRQFSPPQFTPTESGKGVGGMTLPQVTGNEIDAVPARPSFNKGRQGGFSPSSSALQTPHSALRTPHLFLLAGIFAFIASFSRPEAIFIIIPLCIVAFLSKKEGRFTFIGLALLFQVLWIIVSIIAYGSPFRTFETVEQYGQPADIVSLSMGLRLKGFFLPYYFLVVGLTFIIFYFFVRGLFIAWKKYPKLVAITLIIPILIPALANGAASFKSSLYHTTHYIYLMFFYAPIFAAIGLNEFIKRFGSSFLRVSVCSMVILTCIPLSYIKDFVPQKYNKLFPKVVQFIVTAEEPQETRKLIQFIDDNIKEYPSLIFDASGSESSIFYVPFRTHLAPPEKVLITDYNIPQDKEGFKKAILDFVAKNKKGILMVKKEGTLLSELLPNLTRSLPVNNLTKQQELNKWVIYTYD